MATTAAVPARGLMEKLPVPDEKAQEEALTLLREVFKGEYDKAKTVQEKTALAVKLLAQANQSWSNPADRFVLLKVARDVAAQSGVIQTALEAIDAMADTYAIDATPMKLETLVTASESARLTEHRKAIAEHALPLIDDAVEEDDYVVAVRLGEVALAAARKVRDAALVKQIVARNRELAETKKAHEGLQEALATLKENPTDPKANLAAGKFLCLVKGDWAQGVPMLALGSDAALKTLAQKELRGPTSPEEQVALADGWWNTAQASAGREKKLILRHSADWYQSARSKLTSGLMKTKIENRLEEIGETERPVPAPAPAPEPAEPNSSLLKEAILVMTFEPNTFGRQQSGMYVADLSGKGNHGQLEGATPTGKGKAGSALQFDGKNDCIVVSSLRDSLVQDVKSVTISVWVWTDQAKPCQWIFDVGRHAENHACPSLSLFGIDKSFVFAFLGRNCSTSDVEIRTWHHLVAVWDGEEARIYVDGQLRGRLLVAEKTLNEEALTEETARIGARARTIKRRGRYFRGIIDELAIFTRAATEEEVRALYQLGLKGESLRLQR